MGSTFNRRSSEIVYDISLSLLGGVAGGAVVGYSRSESTSFVIGATLAAVVLLLLIGGSVMLVDRIGADDER